jgi:hypothetical protein
LSRSDFEATVEATLLDLAGRFQVRKILFDPFQMVATAQRRERAGLPIEEFPQSSPNLTAASQNLYELIQSGALRLLPRCGHAPGRLKSRGRRDPARVEALEGDPEPQDRRGRRIGHGRARRGAEPARTIF